MNDTTETQEWFLSIGARLANVVFCVEVLPPFSGQRLRLLLQFGPVLTEAGRVLRPGGRLVMIEPWITAASYVLYRYFHDEDCSLGIDIRPPFGGLDKSAFDGNAAISFKILKQGRPWAPSLHLIEADPFIALPYLAFSVLRVLVLFRRAHRYSASDWEGVGLIDSPLN